ncbi:IucA/IucC family C-terminal-domain containing protein [Neobacillus sp. LXY-4]|uniref:IucA/IucC family C-terminal-domain containing protein n=1 Tax=Neobacillus sp. LXY-4 TaxID=3379826 RepID=UPI003EE193BC
MLSLSHLTEQEISILKGFRLTDTKVKAELSIELTNLLGNNECCREYLQKLTSEFGSPSDKVTASIFIKRYAFLPAIYLYAMTVWNKRLNIEFSNVSIESHKQDDLWLPSFYFKNLSFSEFNTGNRDEWRKEAITNLFRDHLFPVISKFVQHTKISKYVLWENIAVYIFWLYESVLSEIDDPHVRKRALDDLRYIVKETTGELFGGYHQNPLTKYYSEPVFNEIHNQEIRVRKTCCFSNQLSHHSKSCYTCPANCH